MPQFDLISFGPQLLWSTIFLFIFIFFLTHAVAGIGSVIKIREKIQNTNMNSSNANYLLYDEIFNSIVKR